MKKSKYCKEIVKNIALNVKGISMNSENIALVGMWPAVNMKEDVCECRGTILGRINE